MDSSILIWVVCAVSLFWGVGLYNRLMRMRAKGLEALGSAAVHMRQYRELVEMQLSAMGHAVQFDSVEPPRAAASGLDLLLQTLVSMDTRLQEVLDKPLAAQPMQELANAYAQAQAIWNMLKNRPMDLAGEPMPSMLVLQWDSIAVRVDVARQACNDALTQYNQAIEQFPARLIAPTMGFHPATLL